MPRILKTVLPKGKLFEANIIYNNINNPILLLHAVNETSAKRYLNKIYGNTHHFSIISFKTRSSIEKADPRATYKDIRNEKYWDSNTTQKLKEIEIFDTQKTGRF